MPDGLAIFIHIEEAAVRAYGSIRKRDVLRGVCTGINGIGDGHLPVIRVGIGNKRDAGKLFRREAVGVCRVFIFEGMKGQIG